MTDSTPTSSEDLKTPSNSSPSTSPSTENTSKEEPESMRAWWEGAENTDQVELDQERINSLLDHEPGVFEKINAWRRERAGIAELPTAKEMYRQVRASENCKGIKITLESCDKKLLSGARAYFLYPPASITLCRNQLDNEEATKEAFRHELTHAYDWCVANVDMSTKRGLACSEIRAARVAECGGHLRPEACVQKYAAGSVQMAVGSNEAAHELVKSVWSGCYARQVATPANVPYPSGDSLRGGDDPTTSTL